MKVLDLTAGQVKVKAKVGNDQEMAQSERKPRWEDKPTLTKGSYTKKTYCKSSEHLFSK